MNSEKRRLLPPHWALLFLLAELALHRWLPLGRWVRSPADLAGIPIAAAGLALDVWAFLLFRRAKTGIVPFSDSTALVDQGPYRFTRNPMYVGMAAILLGVAIYLGTAGPLLCVAGFVLVIEFRFVIPEEAHLERAFGAQYEKFKADVRRWL